VLLPAVAQGALAIECRADDDELRVLLAVLNDDATEQAVLAERAFLARLEGGCQVPIAAHATIAGAALRLHGLIGTTDGAQVLRGEQRGTLDDPAAAGTMLAEMLLAQGGAAILERLSRVVPAIEAPHVGHEQAS
jgi:hydroxymethylbilane synthase